MVMLSDGQSDGQHELQEDVLRLVAVKVGRVAPENNDDSRLLYDVIQRWIYFRRGHDLDSLKIACCQVSRDFFDIMQQLEDKLFSPPE